MLGNAVPGSVLKITGKNSAIILLIWPISVSVRKLIVFSYGAAAERILPLEFRALCSGTRG